MSDAPIVPQDYASGVKVVDIGDIRVARGMTRRPISSCRHMNQVYCEKERRVWCKDCESDVDAFDAYKMLVNFVDAKIKNLHLREKAVSEAESKALRSRAAKVMDDEWRKVKTVPLCPHCREAILPQDVVGGVARASKMIVFKSRNNEG